jgi:putative transposase
MPFWRTCYHLVWATKNRLPLITPELEPRLFDYLMRKARELDVQVYTIGGMPDHIHLVVSIPPKRSVSETVKGLKGASSHYMSQSGVAFAWQRGYGVLTLGERQRPVAEAYVRSQKTHHNENTDNRWLELEEDEDLEEGPDEAAPSFREERMTYQALGEPPF